MNDKPNQTTRILRRPKVTTDERGRTVWVDPVETANLELVSTQTLKQIIETDDVDTNVRLREVAEGKDGLLARDIDKDRFEIISEEQLQRALAGTDMEPDVEAADDLAEEPLAAAVTDAEELELVSTQMLRTILSPDDEQQAGAGGSAESGFDPYNHS